MEILVSGLSGFTGRHFKRAAEDQGHRLVGLTSDLRDFDGLNKEVSAAEFDYVLHLAAISSPFHQSKAELYDINTVGTQNLLRALANYTADIKAVLLASSASVYGNAGPHPIIESNELRPIDHYGCSKLSMELIARTYLSSLPIKIARPFNYTGPFQTPSFLIPKLVNSFKSGLTKISLGNVHIRREFNDVRFLVDCYLKLLPSGVVGEAYNVCTGRDYSVVEILRKLEVILDKRIEIEIDPFLVRCGDIKALRGSSQKLGNLIVLEDNYHIEDTLRWMASI